MDRGTFNAWFMFLAVGTIFCCCCCCFFVVVVIVVVEGTVPTKVPWVKHPSSICRKQTKENIESIQNIMVRIHKIKTIFMREMDELWHRHAAVGIQEDNLTITIKNDVEGKLHTFQFKVAYFSSSFFFIIIFFFFFLLSLPLYVDVFFFCVDLSLFCLRMQFYFSA